MRFQRNESLKKHTSFRIGGPADYFCLPKSVEELREALLFAKDRRLAVVVLGAGTNTLVLDQGFRGLVIKLTKMSWVKIGENKVQAGAGVSLPRLMKTLTRKGLGGLEFLAGIPGSLGGAIAMNAGAWGRDIGRYVAEVRVLDREGRQRVFTKQRLGLGYRKSRLQGNPWIVTEVSLRLRKKGKRSIEKRIREYLSKRKETQPLGIPNCGSIFKNPRENYAGKLIEEAGCKGIRVGDAQVSAKHANFIVNLGEARAKDVIKLMTRIQKEVKEKSKILLEPEIKIMVKSAS